MKVKQTGAKGTVLQLSKWSKKECVRVKQVEQKGVDLTGVERGRENWARCLKQSGNVG